MREAAAAAAEAPLASREAVLCLVPEAVAGRAQDILAAHKLSQLDLGARNAEECSALCAGSNPDEQYSVSVSVRRSQGASGAQKGGHGRGRGGTKRKWGVPGDVAVQGSCSCPANARATHGICKHVLALLLRRAEQLQAAPPAEVDGSAKRTLESVHLETVPPSGDQASSAADQAYATSAPEIPSALADVSCEPSAEKDRLAPKRGPRILPAWAQPRLLPVAPASESSRSRAKGHAGPRRRDEVGTEPRDVGRQERTPTAGSPRAGPQGQQWARRRQWRPNVEHEEEEEDAADGAGEVESELGVHERREVGGGQGDQQVGARGTLGLAASEHIGRRLRRPGRARREVPEDGTVGAGIEDSGDSGAVDDPPDSLAEAAPASDAREPKDEGRGGIQGQGTEQMGIADTSLRRSGAQKSDLSPGRAQDASLSEDPFSFFFSSPSKPNQSISQGGPTVATGGGSGATGTMRGVGVPAASSTEAALGPAEPGSTGGALEAVGCRKPGVLPSTPDDGLGPGARTSPGGTVGSLPPSPAGLTKMGLGLVQSPGEGRGQPKKKMKVADMLSLIRSSQL